MNRAIVDAMQIQANCHLISLNQCRQMIVKQEQSFPGCKLRTLDLERMFAFQLLILDHFIMEKIEDRKEKEHWLQTIRNRTVNQGRHT